MEDSARLEFKTLFEKTREQEIKFWDDFEDEDSMANNLLDVAIRLMCRYKNMIIEVLDTK